MNIGSLMIVRGRTDISHAELFLALLFDVIALTTQLYLSGGATNPFISLYLVQVALGAMLLHHWSAWGIVIVSAICAGALAFAYRPLDLSELLEGRLFDLHKPIWRSCFSMLLRRSISCAWGCWRRVRRMSWARRWRSWRSCWATGGTCPK